MKLEDIVRSLNMSINHSRVKNKLDKAKGFLVLQKSLSNKAVYKIYKEVDITLWFVNGRKKHRVLTYHEVRRIPDGQEEKEMGVAELEFTTSLFDLMGKEEYQKIIKGEYGNEI